MTTFQNNLAVIKQQIVKNISTNHEILTVPSFQHKFILYIYDINIFVFRISHWTQYSGYSWYFLCSSWNTNKKHCYCSIVTTNVSTKLKLDLKPSNCTQPRTSHPTFLNKGKKKVNLWRYSFSNWSPDTFYFENKGLTSAENLWASSMAAWRAASSTFNQWCI